jgi:hypothetical protein
MAKAMQKIQDKGPKVGFSFAEPNADEMRQVAEKIQHATHEIHEQLGHLQEKLQIAQKEGDKAAIEKLHATMEKMKAEEAMMRQKLAQSFEKMDKGLFDKKHAIRDGAGGSPEAQREMMQMIKELRNEVQQLRREVRELRDQGGRTDKIEKPKPKKEKVSALEEIPYLGRLFRTEEVEENYFQPKVSIDFGDPKVDKRWQDRGKLELQLELQKKELDNLQIDDVEKIKAIELEFKNEPAKP